MAHGMPGKREVVQLFGFGLARGDDAPGGPIGGIHIGRLYEEPSRYGPDIPVRMGSIQEGFPRHPQESEGLLLAERLDGAVSETRSDHYLEEDLRHASGCLTVDRAVEGDDAA